MLLLRWCHHIAGTTLVRYFPSECIDSLEGQRLIVLHEKSRSYALTRRGNLLLEEHIRDLPPGTQLSYRAAKLQRRIRAAEITLTAYRAGLSVFHSTISDLSAGGTYFLTSEARKEGTNPWGSARVVSVANLGGWVYGFHYVCPGIGKVSFADELNLLNNNTAQLARGQRGLFFAGQSYVEVLEELQREEPPSKTASITYGEAYQKQRLPIHLLSCDDVGALQLAIMAEPGYRERLARAIMKDSYRPPLEGHPEWDAMYGSIPLVVAVDMELRRLTRAILTARESGCQQIYVFGLKEQARSVLTPKYVTDSFVKVFSIRDTALSAAGVGELYTTPHEPYLTKEGDVIDAPSVQAHRKMGGSGRGKAEKLVREE